ncbi:uncharacterized protein CheA56a [Drosophila takahashii]|uniref:uncharacterized protein CheA56a n=1 Tax=Drosophila takahashii TaxID=29030 RepID=UPI001CF80290|nr:uncharacterized protein LOC108068680 [Drosophila takahashii]
MSLWWLNFFLILWTVSVTSFRKLFDIRFESLETIAGDPETLFTYKLRLLGRDRLINGSIEFLVDLDDTFDVFFVSETLKNGNWVPGYLNTFGKPCEFFSLYYAPYFQLLSNESNIPTTASEMCPFPKGEYFVKNGRISTKDWPPIAFRGLNRYKTRYIKNNKSTGGLQFTFTIIEKIL